jgi:alkylated DNA repair dioxygenase AlkB
MQISGVVFGIIQYGGGTDKSSFLRLQSKKVFLFVRMPDFDQPNLFATTESAPTLPQGFRYQPEFISSADEQQLVREIQTLPFKEFEFHGYTGKRRVISFGWRYDFNDRELQQVDDIPPFLLPLRNLATEFAGLGRESLQHVLVTEYQTGAGIGWHRDKAVFDEVVGISLLAPCRFRLRRKLGDAWERASIVAAPRSAYLLTGPSRSEWEHSIPPADALRYSITFRNLLSRQ